MRDNFLKHCLSALNWQRGTEADIVKVLEAAREFITAYKNNSGAWVSLDEHKKPIIPTFDRLMKTIQEPTDAPSNS